MKQDIKNKWLVALRSGDYKQTKERLRDDDGYCCLGVLCDIVSDKVGGTWGRIDEVVYEFKLLEDSYGQEELPPNGVLRYTELPFDKLDVLTEMNDGGKSFCKIANWIEANL
jgi:hypothetical protein